MGMTLEEFGRELNPKNPVPANTLNNWERGVTRVRKGIMFKSRAAVRQKAGDILKSLRIQLSMTRKEFGRELNPGKPESAAVLNSWERGDIRVPGKVILKARMIVRKKAGRILKELRSQLNMTLEELGRELNPTKPVPGGSVS